MGIRDMTPEEIREIFGPSEDSWLAWFVPRNKELIAQEIKLKEEKGIPTSWDKPGPIKPHSRLKGGDSYEDRPDYH
jgi:hypothetical protein